MIIYTSTRVMPYVYLGIHKITKEFYIGYREANTTPSHIDLFKYRTSSTTVQPKFDEYDWYIIAEFYDGNDAYDFEQHFIYEHWSNPLLLNEQYRLPNGKKRFKNNEGLKGELHPFFGKKRPIEQCQNISAAKKGKLPGNIDIWSKSACGTKWYYNPITDDQIRIKHGEEIPCGYILGNKSVSKSNSQSPRTPSPVRCIELGLEFSTLKAAAEYVGLKCPRDITDSIIGRGYRKSAAGYHWEFIT